MSVCLTEIGEIYAKSCHVDIQNMGIYEAFWPICIVQLIGKVLFKAFGISSAELTQAYVLIILAIVFSAVVIALLLTNITQAVLPWLGIMKDGAFNYLSLWGTNTVMAIVIIIASTLLTVILVLHQLMKQTPGDLIYDRN